LHTAYALFFTVLSAAGCEDEATETYDAAGLDGTTGQSPSPDAGQDSRLSSDAIIIDPLAPKTWGTSEPFEPGSDGNPPEIAMDPSGSIMLVWARPPANSGRTDIWSRRYTVGSGWGTAQLVEIDDTSNARAPQIAVDTSGNAMAVWIQTADTRPSVWANRYTVAGGWGTAQVLETDSTGNASTAPAITFDGSGNALAVWEQSGSSRVNIWSNRYTVATGWGTPQPVETEETVTSNFSFGGTPSVVFDSAGNALAVWAQSDGTRNNLWSNRYAAGSGWGIAQRIETDDRGAATEPRVAFGTGGDAMAVWRQSDGTNTDIWANRYSSAGGWGVAQLIETETGGAGGASSVDLAIDASGNALAVWHQADAANRGGIRSNRYTVGVGWGTATIVTMGSVGPGDLGPDVGMDKNGNAIAVWTTTDGTRPHIRPAYFTAASGWTLPVANRILNGGGSSGLLPRIAVDGSGNAVAVWLQADSSSRDTTYSVRAARYQ